MTKLKDALFSLRAFGRIGGITLRRNLRRVIAEKVPALADAGSPAQLAWRPMFLLAKDLWHDLSISEKRTWESAARPHHLTGYQYFMSQALRPNPGLYLPLLGGTMQGDIDMAGFKIEDLPGPLAAQEPVTRQYFEDNLPAGGYTEGARVHHSLDQSIPDDTATRLSFDSERYDTDAIHLILTNNSRLTCKTAGIYLIVAQASFYPGSAGERYISVAMNGGTDLASQEWKVPYPGWCMMHVSTIYDLAVNDYVELVVFQNSGDPISILSWGNYSPEFMMQRIG